MAKPAATCGLSVEFGIYPFRGIPADLSAKRGRSLTVRYYDHSNSLFGEWGNFSGQRAKSGPVVQTETVTRSALVSRVTSLQQHRANSGPHLCRPADANMFLLGNLPSESCIPNEICVCLKKHCPFLLFYDSGCFWNHVSSKTNTVVVTVFSLRVDVNREQYLKQIESDDRYTQLYRVKHC